MVAFADISSADRVLVVGTGRGALTGALAGRGASLVGYEVDRENYAYSCRAVQGTRTRIHLANAFEHRPLFDVLVSSLPYSQSAAFVRWLCSFRFKRAVVLLQEDFVRKILAPPGDREYRGISALSQVSFDVRVLDTVARESFSPSPRVDSAMVSFVPRQRVTPSEASNIMRLFSLRRRQVDSALAELGMEATGGHGRRRVFSLTPREVHEICRPRHD